MYDKRIVKETVEFLVSNSNFTKSKFKYIINIDGRDFSMQNLVKDGIPTYMLNFYNDLTEFNARAKKDVYNYTADKAFISSEIGEKNIDLGMYILFIIKTIGFMKFDLEHRRCIEVDRKFEVAINAILDNALRKYSLNLRLEKLYSDHYALIMFKKCYDFLFKRGFVSSKSNHNIKVTYPVTENFIRNFIKNNLNIYDNFTLNPSNSKHTIIITQFIEERTKSIQEESHIHYKAMTILLDSLETGCKGEMALIQNCISALEKLYEETSISWSNLYYEKYAFSYYQLFMTYYLAYIEA